MKKYKGNVALVAVISMLAISLAMTFALSITSVNYKLSTIGFIANTNLVQQVYTCKEEAIRKISRDTTFTGNGNININNIDCTYTVTVNTSNPNYKDIAITANYQEYNKDIKITVDTTTSPIREI